MVMIYGQGTFDNYRAALAAVGLETEVSTDTAVTRRCEGLLLPGGGDIFGGLDRRETAVINAFVARRRPVLGICRGMQALNVYFGGTLHDQIAGHQLAAGDMVHPTCAEGLPAELLGDAPYVTSNHHQAVNALAEVKAMQVDTTTAQKALADLVTQFTALSNSLSDMPDMAEIGGKLQSAISQLAQGAAALSTGTSQLSSVGTQLNTGAGTLAQGASLLEAGMKTFDEEGIEKLGDLAGDDLANVLNHFKAVKEAEKTYTNYGGIREGASGSVKFIVETAEIK